MANEHSLFYIWLLEMVSCLKHAIPETRGGVSKGVRL